MEREFAKYVAEYLDKHRKSDIVINDRDSWWKLFDNCNLSHKSILYLLQFEDRGYIINHYDTIFQFACIYYLDKVIRSKWLPMQNELGVDCMKGALDILATVVELVDTADSKSAAREA